MRKLTFVGKRNNILILKQLAHVFPWRKQTILGQDLLIVEATLSHSDTPHSVGLLLRGDQPDTETYT